MSTLHLHPVYRVTVFVPPAQLETLKRCILAVDDLAAGGYAHGMWESAAGREQLRALPGTASAVGQAGGLVSEPTVRLEFCIPREVPGDRERLQRLLDDGIAAHHPWNSPAVFIDAVEFAVS